MFVGRPPDPGPVTGTGTGTGQTALPLRLRRVERQVRGRAGPYDPDSVLERYFTDLTMGGGGFRPDLWLAPAASPSPTCPRT